MSTFLTDKAPFYLNDPATAAGATLSVGYTEVYTSAAATMTLPTPYVGAFVNVCNVGSAAVTIEVGATASQVLSRKSDVQVVLAANVGESITLIGRSSVAWHLAGTGGSSVGPAIT